MVDFSSVNLRILSPDGKNVLAELQTIDRVGQKTAKNVGAAHQQAFSDMSTHGALAARKLAGELAMIAHEGGISARSMKSLAIEAGSLATLFGPASAIAGAVALTGVAIYNLFHRTREEMSETRKKFEEELGKMVNAGDNASMMKQLQDLYRGTPANNFEDGIQALEARRAPLSRQYNNAAAAGNTTMMGRLTAQLREIDVVLTPIQQKFNEISKAIRDIGNAPLTIRGMSGITTKAQAPGEPMGRLDSLLFGMPLMPGIGKTPGIMAGVSEMRDSVLKALQQTPPLPELRITPEIERLMNLKAVATHIGDSFGQTLAQSIGVGIRAGIEGGGIAGGFKAMAGAVLQAVGGMFEQIGVAALAGMKFMATIKSAILGFAPELGIPAAIGLIVFGASLAAIGGSMGGRGSVGGGGGSGGYGYGSSLPGIIDRGLINPGNPLATSMAALEARPSVSFPGAVFIGTDDPGAQTQIVRLVEKGLARSGRSLG